MAASFGPACFCCADHRRLLHQHRPAGVQVRPLPIQAPLLPGAAAAAADANAVAVRCGCQGAPRHPGRARAGGSCHRCLPWHCQQSRSGADTTLAFLCADCAFYWVLTWCLPPPPPAAAAACQLPHGCPSHRRVAVRHDQRLPGAPPRAVLRDQLHGLSSPARGRRALLQRQPARQVGACSRARAGAGAIWQPGSSVEPPGRPLTALLILQVHAHHGRTSHRLRSQAGQDQIGL